MLTMKGLGAKYRIPIRPALGAGFFLLLVIIYLLGTISTSKLEAIRNDTSDRNQRFTGRLTLAINLRQSAGRAIAAARLYRDAQGLGIRGPVFKNDLAGEKVEMDRLLAEGDQGPPLDRRAWLEVKQAAAEFWGMFNPGAAVTDDQFFEKRSNLEKATSNLVEVVKKEQQQILEDTVKTQDRAAHLINSIKWLAVWLGLVIAVFTFWLTQRQFEQLQRATKRAQDAQDFTRSVLNSLANDVLALDERGEVLVANQAFQIHYGLTEADLARRDYREVLAALPEVAMFVAKALRDQGDDKSYRERIETGSYESEDGVRLLDVYLSPLTIGGRRRGRVVVMVDVTEAERAREELRRNRMLSGVGQMTAQVAHEIYNPLGALKLNVELLEHELNGHAAAQQTVDRLKRGIDHLSSIVMDLRDLTRPKDPERQPTEINQLLDEVLDLASDHLQQKQIRVRREYADEALRGEFDPVQLRKVFLNLVINAVDASPEGGEVTLKTRLLPRPEAAKTDGGGTERGVIAVSVIDHGTGMSAETKRRLFEPFYSTKQHGTGLGMMITQEIVKKHGGKIEVESHEGQGTAVSVYLPL